MSESLEGLNPPLPTSNEINWNAAIRRRFLEKPGEHAIEVGMTGSGKTQGLYHLLNGIMDESPSETILWVDCGKSSEVLKLMQFGVCNFLHPRNREVQIDLYDDIEVYRDYVFYEFNSIPDIFRHIDRGKINILCMAPYYPDPEEYSIVITEFFKTLIIMARDGEIATPLAIFVDEFQMVAPAQGQALNDTHSLGGRWMQRNIDQLRSMGIRIIAAAQAWKKVRTGVRTSFACIMIRQGAEFPVTEIKRLAAGNDKWGMLNREEMVFAFRTRLYSDIIILPNYGDGSKVGNIQYIDHTNRQRVNDINIDALLDASKKKGKKADAEDEE
jgi:hypothetical protein